MNAQITLNKEVLSFINGSQTALSQNGVIVSTNTPYSLSLKLSSDGVNDLVAQGVLDGMQVSLSIPNNAYVTSSTLLIANKTILNPYFNLYAYSSSNTVVYLVITIGPSPFQGCRYVSSSVLTYLISIPIIANPNSITQQQQQQQVSNSCVYFSNALIPEIKINNEVASYITSSKSSSIKSSLNVNTA